MKNLIIFCSNYPFGLTETFLENEIKFISSYFKKIIVYPLNCPSGDCHIRETPDNVTFTNPLLPVSHFKRFLKGLFNLSGLPFSIKEILLLIKKIRTKQHIFELYNLILIYRIMLSSSRFKRIQKEENSILYFYWGKGQVVFLPKLVTNKTFVRIHGNEVDSIRNNDFLPYTDALMATPKIISISEQVKFKVTNTFNFKNQVYLNKLGSYDCGLQPKKYDKNITRLVSVANCIPSKRVDLIVKALSKIDEEIIEWIHFGDGQLLDSLREKAKNELSSNIRYYFKGRVPNSDIINFYKEYYVDLFISVSAFEGIPVSIMEAMSFGIPVFATDAGATGEIVNEETGFLVSKQFNINELIVCIKNCHDKTLNIVKRINSRKFWNKNYNANKNYKKLIEILYE